MLLMPACSATVPTLGSLPILSSPIFANTLISPKHGSIRARVVLITSASPADRELQSNMSKADSSANSKPSFLAAAKDAFVGTRPAPKCPKTTSLFLA